MLLILLLLCCKEKMILFKPNVIGERRNIETILLILMHCDCGGRENSLCIILIFFLDISF